MIEGVSEPPLGLALTKLHHSMVDGVSGAELLSAIRDEQREPELVASAGWSPERQPHGADLVVRGLAHRTLSPFEGLRSAGTRRAIRASAPSRRSRVCLTLSGILRPQRAPSLNGPIGPHHRWDSARSQLPEVKLSRNALGRLDTRPAWRSISRLVEARVRPAYPAGAGVAADSRDATCSSSAQSGTSGDAPDARPVANAGVSRTGVGALPCFAGPAGQRDTRPPLRGKRAKEGASTPRRSSIRLVLARRPNPASSRAAAPPPALSLPVSDKTGHDCSRRASGSIWCKATVSRSAIPWRTAYPQLPPNQGGAPGRCTLAFRGMKMAFEGPVGFGPNVWLIRDRGLHWENADG